MSNIVIFTLFGLLLLYIFKSYNRYTKTYTKEAFESFSISYEAIKNSELGLFVALVAKVAKADGRVDALEAELIGIMFNDISSIFPKPEKTKEILKRIFDEEKQRGDNIEKIAYMLAKLTRRDSLKQQQFMEFLIQLAFVDMEVSQREEEILQIIAEAMHFDPKLYHAIFDKFENMIKNIEPKVNLDDAYELLGVEPNDDMQTIKKAYRKLIKEYHPDIIKSQGRDDDYIKEATQKTQEINQAYEMIKKAKKG